MRKFALARLPSHPSHELCHTLAGRHEHLRGGRQGRPPRTVLVVRELGATCAAFVGARLPSGHEAARLVRPCTLANQAQQFLSLAAELRRQRTASP